MRAITRDLNPESPGGSLHSRRYNSAFLQALFVGPETMAKERGWRIQTPDEGVGTNYDGVKNT